ncbi:MAG: galactokinase [Phycisphaerae bacterium]|nr:galactokinase [Phycisphaerae bacterium]
MFSPRFGGPPAACGIAPGRVEILGNHTDYNGGCVLTAAIDRHVVAVGRSIDENAVRAQSLNFDTPAEFRLDELSPEPGGNWGDYVKSVFAALRWAGVPVGGVEFVVASDVPVGAGLGSSAALEAAVAMLVLQLYPHLIETPELAALLQRGEHEFAGVRCGLLDQFSSLHGRSDGVIFLDCASCHYEVFSLGPRPPAIVICDSRVRRQLRRDAPYNVRRRECEAARQQFSRLLGRELSGLCDVSSADLRNVGHDVPEPLLSRAWHVIGEHERVIAARDHLRAGEVHRLGALMIESHKSSRTRFENSCAALDRLCEAAAHQSGYLGGRLCGAGWGGCTVNLVELDAVEAFLGGMRRSREPRPDDPPPEIYVCHASDGARGERLR